MIDEIDEIDANIDYDESKASLESIQGFDVSEDEQEELSVEVVIDDLSTDIETYEVNASIDSPTTEVTISDHRRLTHRDAEKQHPISAITDLENTLEELDSEAITYQFINRMMEN